LGAFLALVAAVSTLSFAWCRAAVTEAETAEKADAAKRELGEKGYAVEKLALLLAEGTLLLRRTQNEAEAAPEDDIVMWTARTEEFLSSNFSGAHVMRFRDLSGIPPGPTSLSSKERIGMEGTIRMRLARLQQFLSEMPTRTVRSAGEH
jgi:hypothetical protein